MPPYRAIHPPLRRSRGGAHDRAVHPFDGVTLELARQCVMCEVVLRHDHHPGRTLVEAMHDPRPEHAAHPGEIAAVVEQGVHERAPGVAGCGVHHEARGFIDHHDVGVLIEHLQRDGFGLGAGR